jgi:hypothetical protein
MKVTPYAQVDGLSSSMEPVEYGEGEAQPPVPGEDKGIIIVGGMPESTPPDPVQPPDEALPPDPEVPPDPVEPGPRAEAAAEAGDAEPAPAALPPILPVHLAAEPSLTGQISGNFNSY